MVTFKDYSGNEIDLNPASVVTVSTYQHYDHDLEMPKEFYVLNPSSLRELDAKRREEADRRRTSVRVIIRTERGSFVVQGTLAEVKSALSK